MAGSAAIFESPRRPHRSCPVLWRFLRNGGRIYRPFHSECPLSLCGPERSRLFALIAFELVCHPEQRAEDDGAIIAGQVHDASLRRGRPVRSGAAYACGARLAMRAYHAAPLLPAEGCAPPGCARAPPVWRSTAGVVAAPGSERTRLSPGPCLPYMGRLKSSADSLQRRFNFVLNQRVPAQSIGPFFGSTRVASILSPRPLSLSAAAAGPVKAGRVFRGHPKGLGLDWPEHGGILDRIGVARAVTWQANSNGSLGKN